MDIFGQCGGLEVPFITTAAPSKGVLNQSHARSINCLRPSIVKARNKGAAQ
jgi:hypothetical protein